MHSRQNKDRSLLLVEDNPLDVELIKRELAKSGLNFVSHEADDEVSLRRVLNDFEIDCVLCDYSLPMLDGRRALEIAREVLPHVPFIIVSGTIGEELAAEIIKAGANDFVLKTKLKRLPAALANAFLEAERKIESERMRLKARQLLSEIRPPLPSVFPWGSRELRVLTIEDNPNDVDLISRDLKRNNVQFVLQNVINEESLLQALRTFRPDVIVSDFILPVFDGLSALHAVRRKDPYIPFIMLSGVLGESEAIDTVLAGATDYVLKSDMKRFFPVVIRSIDDAKSRRHKEEAEKRFAKIVEHSPNGIIVAHANGKPVLANRFVERLSQYVFDEVLDIGLEKLLPGWMSFAHHVSIKKDAHDEAYHEPRQFSMHCKDGSIVPVEINMTQIRLLGETLLLLSIIDLREREEAERAKQLDILAQRREEFVAALAHDLKGPLVGTNRILEVLSKDAVLRLDHRSLLNEIRHSNVRLIGMIENLIDVDRFEDHPRRTFPRKADLVAIIRRCLREVEPVCNTRAITLEVDLVSKCWLRCDDFAIGRVIQNLIDNALKFTTDQGKIEISLTCAEGMVVFSIYNTGAVIQESDLPRLFERFWRGVHGRRYSPGTGIGLYYCKKVVEAHGGEINCVSGTEIGGTRFLVKLPVEQPDEWEQLDEPDQPEDPEDPEEPEPLEQSE